MSKNQAYTKPNFVTVALYVMCLPSGRCHTCRRQRQCAAACLHPCWRCQLEPRDWQTRQLYQCCRAWWHSAWEWTHVGPCSGKSTPTLVWSEGSGCIYLMYKGQDFSLLKFTIQLTQMFTIKSLHTSRSMTGPWFFCLHTIDSLYLDLHFNV